MRIFLFEFRDLPVPAYALMRLSFADQIMPSGNQERSQTTIVRLGDDERLKHMFYRYSTIEIQSCQVKLRTNFRFCKVLTS